MHNISNTDSSLVDAVIVCVGEAPEAEVLGDINDLTLSNSQIELVK
jgi:hypothetical protein